MTGAQWMEIVDEVKLMWGNSAKWSNADGLASRVGDVSHSECQRILEECQRQGDDHPPAPGALIGRAKREQETDDELLQRLAESYCETNGHLEAVQFDQVIGCARCGLRS